uniref:Uncharacterized protein n=1 Tax=Avena sativa TaxID=4498 RepID=A0ACD5ZQF5_AVESA
MVEAQSCRVKCLLYGLLIAISWLSLFLFHFQFVHISVVAHSYLSSSHLRAGPAALAVSSVSSPPAPTAVRDDDAEIRLSPSQCEGRRVYMLDLPSEFNLLKDCVEGSPAFEDETNACVVMSNAGLGPALPPVAGNDTDGVIIPENGWFNTNQHALEVIFHNRMRQYECLTDDPAAATAVYVPYYAGLEMYRHTCYSSAAVRETPSAEFLRWLSSRPRWAALGGRDHFMVASKTTWMFRRAPSNDSTTGCGNGFLLRPESANMTVLTHESNMWARRDMAVPYPTYFHPSSAADVAAWQARARDAPRPWLFAFAGARRPSSGLVLRGHIIDKCVASPGRCRMLDCSHGLEGNTTCRSPEKVMALFTSSRFCLQPVGDSYMRRSSIDAVVAGCIPVFFHEASTFERQYRWHEPDNGGDDVVDGRRPYSVLIPRLELLAGKVDIEEVLTRYSDEEVAAMREEVVKMIPRFMYKDPRVRFEGEMKDGFDIAMEGVMARTRRIRNGEDLGWNL